MFINGENLARGSYNALNPKVFKYFVYSKVKKKGKNKKEKLIIILGEKWTQSILIFHFFQVLCKSLICNFCTPGTAGEPCEFRFVCLSVYLSVRPSVHPYAHPSAWLQCIFLRIGSLIFSDFLHEVKLQ